MKQTLKDKTKDVIFFFIIAISMTETAIHIEMLLHQTQPRRQVLWTYKVLLSPAALVFDRMPGFFSGLTVEADLENTNKKPIFLFKEVQMDSDNYLVTVLTRKIQSEFFTKHRIEGLVRHYFCEKNLRSFSSVLEPGDVVKSVQLKLNPKIKQPADKTYDWTYLCPKI